MRKPMLVATAAAVFGLATIAAGSTMAADVHGARAGAADSGAPMATPNAGGDVYASNHHARGRHHDGDPYGGRGGLNGLYGFSGAAPYDNNHWCGRPEWGPYCPLGYYGY